MIIPDTVPTQKKATTPTTEPDASADAAPLSSRAATPSLHRREDSARCGRSGTQRRFRRINRDRMFQNKMRMPMVIM
jgi:hypothetical protein